MFDLPQAGLQLEALKRRGAELFAHNCRGCHGPAGRGDGLAAASLLPAPRDLTSARFATRRLSQSLWSGVPGSSMPGWSDLSVGELRSLVAFLQSLEPDEVRLPAPVSVLAQSLYARNCVICHGADGGGTGLAARVLTPAPTDFRHVQPSLAYAEQALARGVPGTAMPPWEGKLSASERQALVRYVQSFYQPELPANE
jgi:mono/diheme cytochrome c family protein